MRAFLDTSALIKRYVEESGAQRLDALLESISEITVSPTLWLEVNSAVQRKRLHQEITQPDAETILAECRKDLAYFSKVIWNETLEKLAVKMLLRHRLRTLDSLQLASAILSEAEIFVTSDRRLHAAAASELDQAEIV